MAAIWWMDQGVIGVLKCSVMRRTGEAALYRPLIGDKKAYMPAWSNR